MAITVYCPTCQEMSADYEEATATFRCHQCGHQVELRKVDVWEEIYPHG